MEPERLRDQLPDVPTMWWELPHTAGPTLQLYDQIHFHFGLGQFSFPLFIAERAQNGTVMHLFVTLYPMARK